MNWNHYSIIACLNFINFKSKNILFINIPREIYRWYKKKEYNVFQSFKLLDFKISRKKKKWGCYQFRLTGQKKCNTNNSPRWLDVLNKVHSAPDFILHSAKQRLEGWHLEFNHNIKLESVRRIEYKTNKPKYIWNEKLKQLLKLLRTFYFV